MAFLLGHEEQGQASDDSIFPLPVTPGFYGESHDVLPADKRVSLRRFIGDVLLGSLKSLSEEDARILATVRGEVFINVPTLTTEVAHALAAHRGRLGLCGVSKVSDEIAVILGNHDGSLSLPDCQNISSNALRSLVRGNRYGIALGDMTVTEEHARALEGFGGRLAFGQIALRDEHAAEALARYKGKLDLAVCDLSAAAAGRLARRQGDLLLTFGDFDTPPKVTDVMAAQLEPHEGRLTLSNVTFEPSLEAVMAKLAGHQGEVVLLLPRSAPLTLSAAKALSEQSTSPALTAFRPNSDFSRRHNDANLGDLVLGGFLNLTPEVAEALAQRSRGKLSLRLNQPMIEPIARALARHSGPLEVEDNIDRVPANQPTAEVVTALCGHRGSLGLPGHWIRPDTIDSVLAHEGGLTVRIPATFRMTVKLASDGGTTGDSEEVWEWMPLELVARLATYSGPLHFQGHAPDEIVKVLSDHRGSLAVDRLPQSEVSSQCLLGRRGSLFITCDSSIESVAAAKVFAAATNRTQICTSRHLIGPTAKEIATILTHREGMISLPRLEYIKADALRILAMKDDTRLPPLDSLYILSEDGQDVSPSKVVSERFLKINAENQPPPAMQEWHSWDKLNSGAE